jgi:hypothetical protein
MVRYAVANTPYFCTLFNSHSLAPDLGSVVFSPHQNPFHSVYSPHKAAINYPHLKL